MKPGTDLTHFREQLKKLLRASGYSQKDLAGVLGLHHQVLSRKLVGNASAFLTHGEIKQIIKTLVEWQTFTDLNQALELLALTGLNREVFSLQEWQQPPLSRLKPDQPLHLAFVSTSTEPEVAKPTVAQAHAPGPARFNNLPAPLNTLIGREWAISRACQMLREQGVRLLTLLGPGGSGKTRLALALAQQVQSDFEQGVCFVGLASLTNPQLVIPTIARTLGIAESESAGSDPLEQLGQYLAEMELLLVLDNFEQILPAVSEVAELLVRAPRLKIVATSREALRLYGEHEFGVPPLDLPDLDELPVGERLYQYETVRLFTERARAVKPDFVLTVDNEKVVAQICHILEGLPLAIELAVAWLRLLSPQTLLERLLQFNRLDFLVGGAANLPARHQTLRNTVEWSYRLLSPHQQQLFGRLAIFRNGFTVEAVREICFDLEKEEGQLTATSPLPDQALAQLVELFDKNLVKQQPVDPKVASQEASHLRFMLLETVREYVVEQLQKSGQEAELSKRHAAYYAELTEIAVANLMGGVGGLDVRQLELELDNLRAALNWSRASKHLELHYRLLGNLWRFWRFWGLISEGCRYLEKGLSELNPVQLSNYPSARHPWLSSYLEALYGAGILAIRQQDYAKAAQHLEQGLEVATKVENVGAMAQFLCALGELNRKQAFYESASAYYQQSLELYIGLDDKTGLGILYHNLGALAHLKNQPALARHYCKEALSIWEAQNNKLGITGTTNILAEIALAEGNYALARLYCERSLEIKAELGDKTGPARLYLILGYVCLAQGNYREARELLGDSQELLKIVDDLADLSRCLNGLGFLFLAQGELEKARGFFLESLELSQKESVFGNLIGLAGVLKKQGEPVKAIQLCGTTQKLVETEEGNLIHFYRSEYEQTLNSLRSACQLKDFERAWQQGYNFKRAVENIEEGTDWISVLGQLV